MQDYYKGGKRVTIGGVPCRVAKWVTDDMLAVMRESSTRSIRLSQVASGGQWVWRFGPRLPGLAQ